MYSLFIIFLLSYILSRLNTENFFIDIFNQLSFQILIGGIILFLILLFIRKFKTSIACILICLILAVEILPNCKNCNSYVKMNPQNDTKIRLMTFNTSYAVDSTLPNWFISLEEFLIKNKNLKSEDTENLEILRNLILTENPDIVQFEETTSEFRDKIEYFESIFPYRYIVKYEYPNIADSVILSRYPFKKNNSTDNDPVISTIIIKEAELNILSVHLYSGINQTRFNIANKQIETIKNQIKDQNQNLIVIGDFNMTPISRRFINFLEEANLYTYTSFLNHTSTWPAFLPNYLGIQIDHVLFSENFKVIKKKTIKNLGSDHRALIVDLVF